MADATAFRGGANNGAADKQALFLKVFGGEVLTAFEETNVMADKHMVRTIKSGKSAQFPATWKVAAAYHTPGAELVGQALNVSERVISVDDLLIADVFIPKIDEAMNHYDYRSIYSTECGRVLANTMDANLQQVGLLAARASGTITGTNPSASSGGSALTAATYGTDASVLAGGIYDAAQTMDEKDVPAMGDDRFAFVKPAQYYLLAQNLSIQDKDVGGPAGYSDGRIFRIGGVNLVKTNHLPQSNVATGPTAYQGDFSTTMGLVMHKGAIGTVKLLDLNMDGEWDVRRRGTLILAEYAVGHGILRPECAVELKTA